MIRKQITVKPDSSILLEDACEAGILRLTLNDIDRRNVLSEEMLSRLVDALTCAEKDATVRVIVLAAVGPAFSAGHDLKQLTAVRQNADGGRAYFTGLLQHCAALMQLIVNHPKPIIAEVSGVATAAGCQLVASCDLAVAAQSSKFSTPGVHIGLFCSTPMVALSRNLSNKAAMEMLLTGGMLSAQRAEQIGLVNRVVANDDLTESTMQLARTIASKSSMALATGKQAFYAQREMTLQEAYDYASKVMLENLMQQDAIEGINAFIEKRPAQWQDK